jgi:ribonuclease H / adenosylcobalamin/alpha-ribazole phosphatase
LKLLLVRHVHSLDESGDGQGPTDLGLVQARLVARHLASMPLTAIVSSPYSRCLATATAIATARDGTFEVWEELREIQAQPGFIPGRHDFATRYPRTRPPAASGIIDVDTGDAAIARVERAYQRLRARFGADDTILLVGHANLFNYLVKRCLRLPYATPVWLRFDHGSISAIDAGLTVPATADGLYCQVRAKVLVLNDTRHLARSRATSPSG